jgi:hypothetical protein
MPAYDNIFSHAGSVALKLPPLFVSDEKDYTLWQMACNNGIGYFSLI